jgi:hypothetical protein
VLLDAAALFVGFFSLDWTGLPLCVLFHQQLFFHHRIMTTYRDAVRRLQIIYNDCAVDDKKKKTAQNMDDFGRLKRQIHIDVKAVRQVCADWIGRR